MKPRVYIIIGVAMLLLVSCGQKQRAKSVVKDFMEAHLQDAKKVDYLDFASVDSTRVISDSLISVMRQQVPAHFQQPIQYQSRQGKTLFLMRVRYLLDKDTCSATFYMDSKMTGVVAFKEN